MLCLFLVLPSFEEYSVGAFFFGDLLVLEIADQFVLLLDELLKFFGLAGTFSLGGRLCVEAGLCLVGAGLGEIGGDLIFG